jgi:hypothetical protein
MLGRRKLYPPMSPFIPLPANLIKRLGTRQAMCDILQGVYNNNNNKSLYFATQIKRLSLHIKNKKLDSYCYLHQFLIL